MTIKWFVGSNGNQFADFEGSRFCIIPNHAHAFTKDAASFVSRNGEQISKDLMTFAESRQFIVDQCHIQADTGIEVTEVPHIDGKTLDEGPDDGEISDETERFHTVRK